MAEAVKKEYEASLSDLTFNSKPLINMLTMLAEENVKYAPQIVEVIEDRLHKAKPTEKLPVLYLMDSIIKNMKGSYLEAFTPNIVQTFCSVFEKVDEKTRQSLFKLRMTWASFFPVKKLYAMDLKVKELDPAWPIVADPTAKQPSATPASQPAKQPAAIHVNPKFIKKPSPEATKVLQPGAAPAPAPATTSIQLTEEELAERKKKESERQEMEMRQQLIKKQEQLLQLQQKRLEFELQQTQSKLEEQALELKQKNEQLLIQQQALQQQQHQQQQHQQQAAAAWPGAMPVPPMWPPGSTMMPGPDPMMPVHSQQAPFLPPPPMPPFGISQQIQQQQQQQQFPPPMQPVLPIQQVPPLQQVGQAPPVNRDPRVARDPRLARRDPRIRGTTDASSTMPPFTSHPPLAVATVPPVQSAASASVNAQHAGTTTPLNDVSQASTPHVKSVITVAPSQPKAKPPAKPSAKKDLVKEVKAPDTKQPADPKRETKPEVKKDAKSETKKEETKAADSKTDPKPKAEGTAKQSKSNDRSPRRSSDEKRDTKSDSKSRDRTSREPEARRTSRDTKKDFDKRDSWSSRERDRDSKERDRDSRERDRDSRERDRDHRDRLKDRISGPRESSRQVSSRRRSNRSRSRSRSPVSRSRSPRGSDKGRSTATRGNTKVDKFGRDLPRPVKDTKEEKKPDLAPESRKAEKKPETVSESHKKDVDDRIKSLPVSKEKSSVKDEKPVTGKSEKRRSPSPNKEVKGAKTNEEAPNKRPRLENEESSKKAEKSSKQELDKGTLLERTANQDSWPEEHPSRPKGALPLGDRPPHHLEPEPLGWDRDRQHPSDRLDHERMLLSPDSRKERPRRRLSIDPNVHIPKELSLEKHAFILEQAEKQLHSGELSHQQHQELLRDLFELHRHQKQQKDDRHHELHPQGPYFRREYPDEPRRRYAQRMDSREHDSWSRHSDIDHRRFPMQDIDMRVFDPGHPVHAATAKTRGDNPDTKSGAREQLALPSEDKDERTRDSLHKDRDDRVKAPTEDDKPLKSILKPRKPLPLESPLSPEPAEKQGNDSKVKVEGEANVETRDKEEKLTKDQDKAKVISDEKASPISDGIEDVVHLDDVKTEGAIEEEEAKTKGKKKNKKKKKKGKGTEAEVHVEVTAFEENLEIKPPVFNEKKNQPLMDMDERRNSTDNEPSNVLPAPFREADDLEELFPAGKDRDERRGPGHQLEKSAEAVGLQQRDGPPLKGSHQKDLLRERPPVIDQIKEDPPRDPRLRKGPLLNTPSRDDVPRQEPVRDGLLGEFPESNAYRETLPRHLSHRGRHPNERPPEEGLYRDGPPRGDPYAVGPPRDHLRRSPPREMAFRDGPPRDGMMRGGPRDGPFRDGPQREDPYRDEASREHPYRERLPIEGPFRRDGPFRDGPHREGPFRDRAEGWAPYDDRPSEGRFREAHPREGPFRDVSQRGGPFREVYQGEGYPRDGEPRRVPFREGPPRDDALRDGPPLEGRFRDGPPREGPFRDGPRRGGPFRDGPPREGSLHGEGPFREGPFRDGPPQEDPSRRSPPRRDGPFRGGPERNGSHRGMHPHELREGPLRKGPLMEGHTREPLQGGSFRDGPPRDPPLRRSPLEEAFRERPPEGFPRDGPPAFEEPWDPRQGPPPDKRFPNGPNELRPRPLMDLHPGQLAPPTDKFEVPKGSGPVPNDPSKMPGMVDSDERRPQPTNQRAPDHVLPGQAEQTPVEMQDKPPSALQPTPTLPHTQAQPRLPVPQPMNLPLGLRMPNLLPTMHPFQVLAEQARANLQQAAGLRLPYPPGMLPPRSQFLGAGLPMGAPGPNFLSMGQPRPALALPGVPHVLQQMPTTIGQQLQGQPHFNPRGIPGPSGPLQGQMAASGLPNPALMGAPHLRQSGNPTGTPPLQQPAPLDINSLFAKLVGAGILPPTRSDSPVVPGTGTPPPVDAKEESEAGDPGSDEDLFVPELGMYPEELKCRYEGVINRIYTGTQCSSCGMRFVIDEMDRYRKHLDWHFRQNRRDKDGVKAVQNRKWFYDVDQWLDFEEINDMDDERSNFFEEMALQTQTDKDGVHCVAIDASIEGDEMCSLCHEPFEQFFDEDEEVWMLRDAVRFNKRSFHPGCYEDAKDASLLETPTPGEEGLNSSFDSTVSPLSAYSQLHASTKQSVDPQKDSKYQLDGQPAAQPQSSSPSAYDQTDPSASATPHESVDKQENPLEDKQNQVNVSTGLDASSTGQVVDTQDEVKEHPGSVQSTDEVMDAQSSSQPCVDTSIVKTEAVSTDESKVSVKEEVEQPMETGAQVELTLAVKQEAADPIVKTEPTVDPPQVKMEVESNSEACNLPQESLVDEKMEVADPHVAQQETSSVDNVQPMETLSEAASSTEEVPVNEPVDRTSAPSSSEPETGSGITACVPTNPENDPVVEQTVQTSPSEGSQTEPVSGQPSEISAVLPTGTESPPAQASGLTPEQTESPSEEPASNLGDPRTENNSGGTEEKKEGAQEPAPVVADSEAPQSGTKPSQSETETPSSSPPVPRQVGDRGDGAGGESKPETQTEAKPPTATSEVQNIQAISVIGRARVDPQRRRDVFFR